MQPVTASEQDEGIDFAARCPAEGSAHGGPIKLLFELKDAAYAGRR